MRFVTDENFPIDATALLKAFDKENDISSLLDHCGRGTADLVWIPLMGAMNPRPVIVSGDGRILTNRVERAALKDSQLTYIYLGSGWNNIVWNDFALKIIRVWPKCVVMASKARVGSIIAVTASEKISIHRI